MRKQAIKNLHKRKNEARATARRLLKEAADLQAALRESQAREAALTKALGPLVARLESIAHRATARNLVVEDWNHIGPEVDAARAAIASPSDAAAALLERLEIAEARPIGFALENTEADRDRWLGLLAPFRRWPSVYAFALAMVAKLDHHAPKKGGREGWVNDSPGLLADRAEEEMDEFQCADKAQAVAEAADVANMLMMTVDAEGLLDVEAARRDLEQHDGESEPKERP